jgi:hypothetical protein
VKIPRAISDSSLAARARSTSDRISRMFASPGSASAASRRGGRRGAVAGGGQLFRPPGQAPGAGECGSLARDRRFRRWFQIRRVAVVPPGVQPPDVPHDELRFVVSDQK